MGIAPLNTQEWLEQVRTAGRYPADDFATEVLDIIAADRTDDFHTIVEDLEKAAGRKFEDERRLVEFFTDRHHLLAEVEDRLQQAGYGAGDPDDALDRLGRLLSDLEDAREELEDAREELAALRGDTTAATT